MLNFSIILYENDIDVVVKVSDLLIGIIVVNFVVVKFKCVEVMKWILELKWSSF